jgi:hypothetical protein
MCDVALVFSSSDPLLGPFFCTTVEIGRGILVECVQIKYGAFIFAAVSLILCVAIGFVWRRSYQIEDELVYTNRVDQIQLWNGTLVGIASDRGELCGFFEKSRYTSPASKGFRFEHWQDPTVHPTLKESFRFSTDGLECLGFGYVVHAMPSGVEIFLLLPEWFLVLLFGMPPVMWALRVRK